MTDEQFGKFPISEFSLDEMCEDASIILIAKRGSGKSWITRAIMHKLGYKPFGIVISPTEKDNPFYSKFFPDSFIYHNYDTKIITKILNRQRTMLKKQRDKEAEGKKIDPSGIVVMDDCLASKGAWAKDPNIADLLMNGRHRKLTYILTMQFPLGISPELRANFDYIFLLADDVVSNLKRIYEHYAGMFPNFESFRQVFQQLTEDHGAMVIKNRGERSSLLDKIGYYKAPDLSDRDFMFGCSQFKKYHKNNYNSEWEDDKYKIMNIEQMLINNKKNKTKLDIRKISKDI
uniref:Uncharacterized protein n=1 Tax=viral metagenome TaxID=1070528 RepID=A0A6C0BDJ5_9ZZZZ